MRRKQLFLNHSSKSGEWRKPPSNGPTAYDVCVTKLHTPYVGKSRNLPQPRYICFLGSTVYQTTIASIDMICGRTLLTPPSLAGIGSEEKTTHLAAEEGAVGCVRVFSFSRVLSVAERFSWECQSECVCGTVQHRVDSPQTKNLSLKENPRCIQCLQHYYAKSDCRGQMWNTSFVFIFKKVLCNINLLLKFKFFLLSIEDPSSREEIQSIGAVLLEVAELSPMPSYFPRALAPSPLHSALAFCPVMLSDWLTPPPSKQAT